MKFFDINTISQEGNQAIDKSGFLVEKFLNVHCEKISSIKQLAGSIPQGNDIYFLWTINSFNAFTFIPFIIKECGIIEELIIATYSINIRIIDALIRLVDRLQILKITIVISDSIKTLRLKVYDHLKAVTERYNINIIYTWNHSKISLLKTKSEYFIVEGSGNFSENARHEQYVFLNSKTVFDFRKNELLYDINR